MRILANENFPKDAIVAVRALGHDVSSVAELCPSCQDTEVLALAVRESRVLVTLDKDFGELAFRSGLPATCGIVLFRVPPIPAMVTAHAVQVLRADASYEGLFVVVEPGRLRERALPVLAQRR